MKKINLKDCLKTASYPNCSSTALLLLRLIAGTAFVIHGYAKMQTPFSWMGPQAPVPGFLQFLAAFSEFGGGIAWIIGLLTPLASLGIGITMTVAVSMHMFMLKDPFVATTAGGSSYEPALVFLGISILFMMMGPGNFSLDSKLFGSKE
jgi:putative oxidoreductase